jgi:hypothetical protein
VPLPYFKTRSETGKTEFWNFGEDGTVRTMIMSMEKDGVWTCVRGAIGPEGKVVAKLRATRVGDDQLDLVVESTLDGVAQPTRRSVWTRKR